VSLTGRPGEHIPLHGPYICNAKFLFAERPVSAPIEKTAVAKSKSSCRLKVIYIGDPSRDSTFQAVQDRNLDYYCPVKLVPEEIEWLSKTFPKMVFCSSNAAPIIYDFVSLTSMASRNFMIEKGSPYLTAHGTSFPAKGWNGSTVAPLGPILWISFESSRP
jgi:hypothetical protein